MRSPITYKLIPTQFAFLQEGNKVRIIQLTKPYQEKEFKDEEEARNYIKNTKKIY